jgi:hypothetical protein
MVLVCSVLTDLLVRPDEHLPLCQFNVLTNISLLTIDIMG